VSGSFTVPPDPPDDEDDHAAFPDAAPVDPALDAPFCALASCITGVAFDARSGLVGIDRPPHAARTNHTDTATPFCNRIDTTSLLYRLSVPEPDGSSGTDAPSRFRGNLRDLDHAKLG